MVVVLGEPPRYLTRRGSKGRNCLQMGFGGILLGCVYEGIFRYVVVTSVRLSDESVFRIELKRSHEYLLYRKGICHD